MKRVLVTGANGQLGLTLQAAAKDFPVDLVFLDKNTLDITNTQAVKDVFANQSFAVCINAAAYTDVDGTETNKALAFAINAKAIETLAKACKQHGC
ncbi:MAG: sugar nucleotide-binding protein, partial [Bacteroidota bacterium]|nr:sugar nucleotide-binding protein [Bacteroidota bacterium]